MIVLEYIWLDKQNNFRSKTRVLNNLDVILEQVKDIPVWNYDGSSTGQTEGDNTEVVLKPIFFCINPVLNVSTDKYLVLCETYDIDGNPLDNNYRPQANKIFKNKADLEPWYGFEQEFFIFGKDSSKLLEPYKSQGQYYCSIGSGNVLSSQREFMNEFLNCCLLARLNISGINAEVAPCQWGTN